MGVLGKFYDFLLNKSSETLSFGAKLLSFEGKKMKFGQKSALSCVILEFLATRVSAILSKKCLA